MREKTWYEERMMGVITLNTAMNIAISFMFWMSFSSIVRAVADVDWWGAIWGLFFMLIFFMVNLLFSYDIIDSAARYIRMDEENRALDQMYAHLGRQEQIKVPDNIKAP